MTEHRDGASGRADATGVGPPILEALSLLCLVAAIAWLPWLTREGRWPIAILVIAALIAGSAGVIADLITLPARRRAGALAADDSVDESAHADSADDSAHGAGLESEGSFTTIVMLGDEPGELQRHSVELAAMAGPCIVVAPNGFDLPDGVDATVVEAAGQDGQNGQDGPPTGLLERAIDQVRTDAVLLLSGRAAPVAEQCRRAAALLDDDHPWAIGRTRPFNADGFAPDTRDRVDAELRRRSNLIDLALWEPNATLVRTTDLHDDPMHGREPRGSWLRRRQSAGGRALVLDEALAFVASPAGSRTFWPESIAQLRGAAADASAATRSTHGTARIAAAALTARTCSAWSLVTWLIVLFIGTVSGELPFRTVHGALFALVGAMFLFRWTGLLLSVGRRPRPVRDLRSAVDRVPGSLTALPSALTARVRPAPQRVSVRPLLWAGLLSVAVLATALIDHSPDAQMTAPAVAAALFTLVALWLVCIQVLVQRGWERTAFRVPVSLVATVHGRVGQTIDASPEGVAIELPLPDRHATAVDSDALNSDALESEAFESTDPDPTDPDPIETDPIDATAADVDALAHAGDTVSVTIELDDRSIETIDATVAWARRSHRRDLLGLRLDLDASNRSAWAAQVLRAAASTRNSSNDPALVAPSANLEIAAVDPSGTTSTGRADKTGRRTASSADAPVGDLVVAAQGDTHSLRQRSLPLGEGTLPVSDRTTGPTFATRCFDAAGLVLTVGLSVLLLAVLGGAMLNLQAAVVRSGSMTPAIAQGAVVISESVPVPTLQPGDVITRPAEGSNGTVTHRLVSATREGDLYRMQTRGDANKTSEVWTIAADARLQRVRWVVPSLGDAVSLLRSNLVIVLGAVLIIGLLVAALRIPRARAKSLAAHHPSPA